jgi:hypothetical protein
MREREKADRRPRERLVPERSILAKRYNEMASSGPSSRHGHRQGPAEPVKGRHGIPGLVGSRGAWRGRGAVVADPKTLSMKIRSHIHGQCGVLHLAEVAVQLTRACSTADVLLASKDCDGCRWAMTTPRGPQQGISLPRM